MKDPLSKTNQRHWMMIEGLLGENHLTRRVKNHLGIQQSAQALESQAAAHDQEKVEYTIYLLSLPFPLY